MRASFRFGLRLGLLIGVGFALYRTVQSRRAVKAPAPEPWQPIVDTPRPRPPRAQPGPEADAEAEAEPAAQPTVPEPAIDLRMPDVPAAARPRRPRDEVGEPIEEPAAPEPVIEDEPVAVAKPAAVAEAEPVTEPEPVMEAEPFLDAAPPAALVVGDPHPLDVVPEPAAAAAPVKKAAKRLAKSATKAVKKAAKKSAVGKRVAPTAANTPSLDELVEPQRESPTEPTPEAPEAPEAPEEVEQLVPAWVKPAGGICPRTHPVKAKLASRLFHLPGMLAYDRTKADRCYRDEEAAVEEGFVRAKR